MEVIVVEQCFWEQVGNIAAFDGCDGGVGVDQDASSAVDIEDPIRVGENEHGIVEGVKDAFVGDRDEAGEFGALDDHRQWDAGENEDDRGEIRCRNRLYARWNTPFANHGALRQAKSTSDCRR